MITFYSGIPTKEALSSSFSGPKTDPFMGAKKKSSGGLKVGIKKVRASFNAAKEVVIIYTFSLLSMYAFLFYQKISINRMLQSLKQKKRKPKLR